jgi:hypothetical protein
MAGLITMYDYSMTFQHALIVGLTIQRSIIVCVAFQEAMTLGLTLALRMAFHSARFYGSFLQPVMIIDDYRYMTSSSP